MVAIKCMKNTNLQLSKKFKKWGIFCIGNKTIKDEYKDVKCV